MYYSYDWPTPSPPYSLISAGPEYRSWFCAGAVMSWLFRTFGEPPIDFIDFHSETAQKRWHAAAASCKKSALSTGFLTRAWFTWSSIQDCLNSRFWLVGLVCVATSDSKRHALVRSHIHLYCIPTWLWSEGELAFKFQLNILIILFDHPPSR